MRCLNIIGTKKLLDRPFSFHPDAERIHIPLHTTQSTIMKKDKRAHERRIPTGNVYAALGHEYERVGKLIDLSFGGLSFEYLSDGNRDADLFHIDIFKVGEVFNLRNLPCKIIYDIPLLPDRNGIKSLQQSFNRRCGVAFSKLTIDGNVQLALFLESHTKAKIAQ